MASDTFNHSYIKPAGMQVALNVDTPPEAERIFKALSEGGEITMKMEETFFAHRFGTVVDRFGEIRTKMTFHTVASGTLPQVSFMLQGMEAGWTQSFDKMDALFARK